MRGGGNYVSLSGNTMFWQVRLRRRDAPHDGLLQVHAPTRPTRWSGTDAQATMTGMWCDPLVGRPETAFLGAGSAYGLYSRFGAATPRGSGAFTVYRDDHWMFAGTGLRYGDLLGADHGVVGYETVGCRLAFDDTSCRSPPAATARPTTSRSWRSRRRRTWPWASTRRRSPPSTIRATSSSSPPASTAASTPTRWPACRHGNAVMLTCRPFGADGGEVVTIGSTDWVFGLAGDPLVAQVTRNVLDHCLSH